MQTLSDRERLHKIQEAVRLLREVEFSYKEGEYSRRMIYGVMVDKFSLTHIGALMTQLKDKVWQGQQGFPKQVRCVDPKGMDLTVGRLYTATSKDSSSVPDCYVIERNDSDEPDFYYDVECFVDVE